MGHNAFYFTARESQKTYSPRIQAGDVLLIIYVGSVSGADAFIAI